MSDLRTTQSWYDASYAAAGFAGQRLYPNEELLRFMGRHFFGADAETRKRTAILEIGCGSCANLWMIAREGFDAHGIDLSAPAIELGGRMLARWQTSAHLRVGSMTELPYSAAEFDAVVDVFSSNCLPLAEYRRCLGEVARVLRPGGLFFTYTPSARSDAFRDHAPSTLLDEYTLAGVRRPTSPYVGNLYPFRFMPPELVASELAAAGLRNLYLEVVSRTYRGRQEQFEFVVAVGEKAR